MLDSRDEISREPLWAVPAPIQERLQARLRDREQTHFQLCGLYSAVAVGFLVFFGFAALGRGEPDYAAVIFGFAIATAVTWIAAWFSRNYTWTRHVLTLLMGALCLYLFYTGGTDNTGPMYALVFPLVAVFLQGPQRGVLSVLLLAALMLMLQTGMLGFDTTRYGAVLLLRLFAINLIITLLAYLFEYFRLRAEQELLLSLHDLSQLTYGDLGTHLANRRLMEKLLISEVSRARRYPVDCCGMLVEIDEAQRLRGFALEQARKTLSLVLRRQLRMQDIPGVWDENRFLVLLPLTPVEGAVIVAERMLAECRKEALAVPGAPGRCMTISIGLASVRQQSAEAFIEVLSRLVQEALRSGGDRIVTE